MYEALNEVLAGYKGAKVFGDIGCYTLGALPPFRAIDTCIDMGALSRWLKELPMRAFIPQCR